MSEQQMTRRQVYAFIALAALAPPESVTFVNTDSLHINLGDDVDPFPWLQLLGADPANMTRQRYDEPKVEKHGFILSVDFRWQGWRVWVRTFRNDGPSDPFLDEQTVEQLQALTAGDVELVDQALAPPAGEGPVATMLQSDTALVVRD